ncbi:hypothetical protein OROMI_029032 [Orobanche minor]
MNILESVDNLPVQDPPGEDFSSADLHWVKFGSADHCDDVALIPYDRVDAFIIGECCKVECPTRFHIERGRKRARGSLKQYKNDDYLEYRMYWCSFGPENYGEGGGILPSRRYRLNTRNRAARPQSMRGCTCHFVVKRLYARPSFALLIYNERRHVNKAGFVCHGPLDKDAIGPKAKKVPYVCSEIQQQTMSMIYLGIPEENVLEKHMEGIQRYGDSDARATSLASQYVQKLGMIIKRSTHELDLDDQASIRLWAERNEKSVFFYRDTTENEPFILGIQTEWQLQQMIRFGHRNIMAVDSTFGIKRLKYPLCTILVFDSRQHALPVAWIITRSIAKPDVANWMKALLYRVRSVDLEWRVNGFLIDDAATDVDPIREMKMWLTTTKALPIASQEAAGAIEAYHVKLKSKLYDDDSHLGSVQRVDWLVHKLTTELHSSYWLDRYADESDSFLNVKEEYIASTSWHRALEIPDTSVSLDHEDRLFAKVISQKDGSLKRVVWNPGSEFAHCDCEWSLQGNLCKHVIKVNMICEDLNCYQSSMSFQSFKNILIDLWRKPMDDSVALDISTAWTFQMLDQIKSLVQLNNSNDIGLVVNSMPLKWVAKRARTSCGRQVSVRGGRPSAIKNGSNGFAARKKSRKRKRTSRLS